MKRILLLIVAIAFLGACSSVPLVENEKYHDLVGEWEVIDNTFPNGDEWGDSHYEFSPDGLLTIHHWLNPIVKMGNRNEGTWKLTRISSTAYSTESVDQGENNDPNWEMGKAMKMTYRLKDDRTLYLSWGDNMSKKQYLVLKPCDQTCRRENP